MSESGGHRSITFVVPGPIVTRTGGSIYDARIVDGLGARGVSVDVIELGASSDDVQTAAVALSALPDGTVAVIDGLILPAVADVVEREASRLQIVALVHLPRAADVTLDSQFAERLREREHRALRAARHIIVTSPATVPMLADYRLPAGSVSVVEPGTDGAAIARGSGGNEVHLLCVAAVHAGKGHDILLHALAAVPMRNWRLICAGSLTRDAAAVNRVRQTIRALGLDDRVGLRGELNAAEIEECYDRADVFVLATLQETYGMAVAEALAHGLPVVSTTTGAIPSLVDSRAGILVPPGDSDALAIALARIIDDAGLRVSLAQGARRARERLPTWDDACTKFGQCLDALA